MKRYLEATRAEFLKVFTTKVWWVLAIIMVAYLGFIAAIFGFSFYWAAGQFGSGSMQDDGSAALMIYTMASTMGFFFPVLLGALAVTGEYRHRTIVPTFLTVAKRGTALAAKATVQFLVGLLFGVIAFATTVFASVFFLTSAGLNSGLTDGQTWVVMFRAVLVMAVWAVIGVGIGSLIPNQAAVLIVVIGFTQFIEPILRMAAAFNETFGKVAQFLPGAVSDGFGGTSFYSAMNGLDGSGGGATPILDWWVAGLVLLGYVVVTVVAGYLVRWRSDVK